MLHLDDTTTPRAQGEFATSYVPAAAIESDHNSSLTVRRYAGALGGAMLFGMVGSASLAFDATRSGAAAKPRSLTLVYTTGGSSRIADDDAAGTDVVWNSSVPDSILIELAKLENGWAGEGSVAPAQNTIDDVGRVLQAFPANVVMPFIEIDDEDGGVSLRWVVDNGSRAFSLVFRGTGRVSAVFATFDPPRSRTTAFSVRDEIGITSVLEKPEISHIITA